MNFLLPLKNNKSTIFKYRAFFFIFFNTFKKNRNKGIISLNKLKQKSVR